MAETKLDIITEASTRSPKLATSPLDPEAVEMVFGKPNSPKVETEVHSKHGGAEKGAHREPNANNKDDHVLASQPLLEPALEKQKPPIAGPEVDDLEGDVSPAHAPYPGIDDGLLDDGLEKKPLDPEASDRGSKETPSTADGGGAAADGKWDWPADEPDYAYDGVHGFGMDNRFGAGERPVSPGLTTAIDVNTYQQKKNLAQGMMDLALLSANANQLRYVLESSSTHPYFYPSLTFITLSIVLQIAVGVGLIMNSRYDVNNHQEICKADKINNMTVLGIFLVTIVNVFITSFSVASPNGPVVAGG